MLTAETIDRLIESGHKHEIVLDEPGRQVITINGKTVEVAKTIPARNHTFATLDGLLDYLASGHCAADHGVIFVGDNLVHADLQYQQPGKHRASLPIGASEEYAALTVLFMGVEQKMLWRSLLSKLDGCFDVELMMQISNIQIKADYVADTKIERTGLGNTKTADVTRVTFTAPDGKGTKTADLWTKWEWEGRIWEAFDRTFKIPLTLEINTEGKAPLFLFHPRRLDAILRTAKLALVEEIKGKAPASFTVHEGTY
jgi:hypothetical protein